MANEILPARSETDLETVRTLFREYESWLDLDLCFQGFEDELRTLPGKYGSPDGRLFIARVNGEPAGCVAMRKIENGVCEMKRLYVRTEFRGLGVGNLLIEKLIKTARTAGYSKIRLDTYPLKMSKAVKLYESHGFRSIPPYYANPHKNVVFMELAL
ncbi:MAG: GNAT family N-acetyltransferase [Acidobacteria bacterium]|nr:GNAT family N-acetyltransferase [Acidobacteriota bacterium]